MSLILLCSCYLFFTDPPAGTPAVVTQDDVNEEEEDSEPSLNEDDDDDDLDDVDQGEELSTQHLVLAQFDKVLYLLFFRSSCAAYPRAFFKSTMPSNIYHNFSCIRLLVPRVGGNVH